MKKEEENKHIEKKILEYTANYSVPATKSKETAWNELSEKMAEKHKSTVSLRTLLKVAAIVAVFITASIYYLFQDTTVKAAYGQTKEVTLPDGSYVLLQAGSQISFNKRDWANERKLSLSGEAYFSVKKGSKFQVLTPAGKVQVLGTKFNVIDRDNCFEVACITGKVSVSLKNKQEEKILVKGFYTRKIDNTLTEPESYQIDKITQRLNGKFAFDKSKLQEVFNELERQFDVKIEYKGDQNRLFTGYFSNKDLDKALKMVCIPMDIEYQIHNKSVILKDIQPAN